MDEKKKKISVRINGKEHIFADKSSEDVTTKIPMIDLSEVDEESKRSNIIDFTKKKNEKRNVEPFWDDGNHEKIPKIPPNNRKKKRRQVLKLSLTNLPVTLIVATISAIIVGVSLGYTMLTLMSTTNASNTSEQAPVVALAESKGSSLIDMENYIVQGGAFSTIEKGKEMATIFQDRGQAGVLVSNTENYFLFIGIGYSKKEAEKISKLYTDHGFETYVKQHKVNGSVVQLDEEMTTFINEGVLLHQQLTEATVEALTNGLAIDKDLLDSAMAWASKSELDGLSEEVEEKMIDYISHIKQAATYLEQYAKESKEDTLWLSQQKLLEAIVSYEQLLLALKS